MPDRTFIRRARPDDLDPLVAIENTAFSVDRLKRRSLANFIRSPAACLLVAERNGVIAGYGLILLRRGTSLARLYSLAVARPYRRLGIGRLLVTELEQLAVAREYTFMRLEVSPNNEPGIELLRTLGYRPFGLIHDYYEDHGDALRLEKRIANITLNADSLPIHYYGQTTDFTCGPASLMMAMNALDAGQALSPLLELQLWREATTIYMLAGTGGCGPHGLALAAWRRGFRVTIYVNQTGPLFLESVRRPEKKEIMARVHDDFMHQLRETDVRIETAVCSLDALRAALKAGHVPLVLISTWRFNRSKNPHWVVVSAMDDRFVLLHDPEVDDLAGQWSLDNQYLPVVHSDFHRMSQFGQNGLRAAVIVAPR